MNTSSILNKAADLIEHFGFGTGSTAGGLCVIQAIYRANKDGHIAARALEAYLGIDYAAHQWNDAPGRTATEVVEALRACAVIEEARESQDAAWATYASQVSA